MTPDVPVVHIYLGEETFTLAVCPECRALSRQEDFADHQAWHARQAMKL